VFDCLIAGDACVDLLVEGVLDLEAGTEKLASGMNLVLGGSSSITAFNLSRLGASVTFASVIGNDLFGHFVEERLKAAGVDLRGLQRTTNEKTGLTIWHSLKGKRAGVTYSGTIASLRRDDIPDDLLRSARHLHVGSYFLLTSLHRDAPGLFARAKQLGLTTSVDCNYDPAERWDSNLKSVLQHTDVFFPNEDEALKITGEEAADGAARRLCELAGTVVVKRGAEGAMAAQGNMQFSVPALPATVVDTTGAGDSFDAGFLARFVKGDNLRACVDSGLLAASKCVSAAGGTAAFEP
jgi:sugar/nucleoside kinase (ribokinase family)